MLDEAIRICTVLIMVLLLVVGVGMTIGCQEMIVVIPIVVADPTFIPFRVSDSWVLRMGLG
jgi:hypothetical protein